MAEPFLAEIRIMSFNFPPKGWAQCSGQFLPINQNQALFALLGTTYGGNGQTTFALPNLRGRVPVHMGAGVIQGEAAGQEAHTLTQSEMPAHVHFVNCTASGAATEDPANQLPGRAAGNAYGAATNLVAMAPTMVGNTGGSQPHENRQPFLVLNFCIALQGIFPSRN
jgi:microcystin-dependent protein